MPNTRNRFNAAAASVALLAGLAAVPSLSLAQDAPAQPVSQDLPSGWEVLEHFAKARGGAERYLELKNFVARGTFSMEAMGFSGPITMTEAAPDKLHMHIELNAMMQMTQATDGEVAWAIAPGSSDPVIMEGPQAEQMLDRAAFHDEVRPRERFESAEVVGIENVEGKACYRVNLRTKSGQDSVDFFSVDTGLRVKTMQRTSPAAETFDSVSLFFDWEEIDGIWHPMTIRQQNQGQEFVIRFDSIEHDAELDMSMFSPPAPETPAGEI